MFVLLCLFVLLLPVVALILLSFLIEQTLSPSDYTTLIAGLLAYYGTGILSIVMVFQNRSMNELQKRERELREIELRHQYRPLLSVSDLYFDVIPEKEKYTSHQYNMMPLDLAKTGTQYKGDIKVKQSQAVLLSVMCSIENAHLSTLTAKTMDSCPILPKLPISSNV